MKYITVYYLISISVMMINIYYVNKGVKNEDIN